MPKEISYAFAQGAEMAPDMYGGESCDQLIPSWTANADGEESERVGNMLTLDARTFPPGTKVVVREPVCPDCGDRRSPLFPIPEAGPIYGGSCVCGFDWDLWVSEQYS